MSTAATFLLIATACVCSVAAFDSSEVQEQPSEAVTTFHVTKPKRGGTLNLKIRLLDRKGKKIQGDSVREIPIAIPAGIDRDEKLDILKDKLDAAFPNHDENGDWVISRDSASVSIRPSETNTGIGRIKVLSTGESATRETVGAMDTEDYTGSDSDPVELSPIPIGFYPPHSPPPLTWQDWIVFSFDGTPTGTVGDSSAGQVGVKANSFEVHIATAGLSLNEILEQIALEAQDYSEMTAAVDYATSRVLLLSEDTINRKGLVCLDNGLDMAFEVMPAPE